MKLLASEPSEVKMILLKIKSVDFFQKIMSQK